MIDEPLTSLDKDEWFDVYRRFLPTATREDFERDWEEFQQYKLAIEKARGLQ